MDENNQGIKERRIKHRGNKNVQCKTGNQMLLPTLNNIGDNRRQGDKRDQSINVV